MFALSGDDIWSWTKNDNNRHVFADLRMWRCM